MILVLFTLTLSFHWAQYISHSFRTFCKSSANLAIITVSSAWNNFNSFKYIRNLCSTAIPIYFVNAVQLQCMSLSTKKNVPNDQHACTNKIKMVTGVLLVWQQGGGGLNNIILMYNVSRIVCLWNSKEMYDYIANDSDSIDNSCVYRFEKINCIIVVLISGE